MARECALQYVRCACINVEGAGIYSSYGAIVRGDIAIDPLCLPPSRRHRTNNKMYRWHTQTILHCLVEGRATSQDDMGDE